MGSREQCLQGPGPYLRIQRCQLGDLGGDINPSCLREKILGLIWVGSGGWGKGFQSMPRFVFWIAGRHLKRWGVSSFIHPRSRSITFILPYNVSNTVLGTWRYKSLECMLRDLGPQVWERVNPTVLGLCRERQQPRTHGSVPGTKSHIILAYKPQDEQGFPSPHPPGNRDVAER